MTRVAQFKLHAIAVLAACIHTGGAPLAADQSPAVGASAGDSEAQARIPATGNLPEMAASVAALWEIAHHCRVFSGPQIRSGRQFRPSRS